MPGKIQSERSAGLRQQTHFGWNGDGVQWDNWLTWINDLSRLDGNKSIW